MTARTLTPPHNLDSAPLIIRAMGGNGADDQRAALNELYRRRLWLGFTQHGPNGETSGPWADEKEARDAGLAAMGYGPAPVPIEARPTLRVIFRADRSGDFKGDVTAVFPTESADYAGREMTCYAHVGQHGGCTLGWYRTTRPASPDEYAGLLAELRRIYERDDDPDAVRLVIARRIARTDHDAREAQARESRAALRRDPRGAPWTPEALA